jgi:SecD/SecF fusion protein
MQMNAKGSKIWEEMTGRANAQGTQIAIVLDDIVYSAPTASSGAISGGNTEIS